MRLSKYQALGNDYLILTEEAIPSDRLTPTLIRRVCDRHFGIGSDGLLVGNLEKTAGAFGLRILNPDGSEAEKSGNGLRIFAKYLWDTEYVRQAPFEISTLGGIVRCQVTRDGTLIDVEMGQVSFRSDDIPMTGSSREVLAEVINVTTPHGEIEHVEISAASIGNPHCIVLRDALSEAEVLRLGPLLECAACFPQRTNVQFVHILNRTNIQIEIWERGAGYTLASGSSSSAAAAVAKRLDKVDERVTVHMPGGRLQIEIDDDYRVRMQGPASKVADVELAAEFLADLL